MGVGPPEATRRLIFRDLNLSRGRPTEVRYSQRISDSGHRLPGFFMLSTYRDISTTQPAVSRSGVLLSLYGEPQSIKK